MSKKLESKTMSNEDEIKDLEFEVECLREHLEEKDNQIAILKHIIGLMGKVIDE